MKGKLRKLRKKRTIKRVSKSAGTLSLCFFENKGDFGIARYTKIKRKAGRALPVQRYIGWYYVDKK